MGLCSSQDSGLRKRKSPQTVPQQQTPRPPPRPPPQPQPQPQPQPRQPVQPEQQQSVQAPQTVDQPAALPPLQADAPDQPPAAAARVAPHTPSGPAPRDGPQTATSLGTPESESLEAAPRTADAGPAFEVPSVANGGIAIINVTVTASTPTETALSPGPGSAKSLLKTSSVPLGRGSSVVSTDSAGKKMITRGSLKPEAGSPKVWRAASSPRSLGDADSAGKSVKFNLDSISVQSSTTFGSLNGALVSLRTFDGVWTPVFRNGQKGRQWTIQCPHISYDTGDPYRISRAQWSDARLAFKMTMGGDEYKISLLPENLSPAGVPEQLSGVQRVKRAGQLLTMYFTMRRNNMSFSDPPRPTEPF
eukprot:TRINITY_DN11789_c0_g1_i1.p1 TRINITY_DN11789_c0_g1~~TRINITY_DN11789_c0_g1_i1.p1  ORF type:complete len:361 (+),score=39.19 TRINITY_DN11789_c0_g1_i1:73-1155(+)